MGSKFDGILSEEELRKIRELLDLTKEKNSKTIEPVLARKIVPIEQWLENPYYVGKDGARLYPFWKNALIDIYGKHKGQYNEVIIEGGLGCRPITDTVHTSDGILTYEEIIQKKKDSGGINNLYATSEFGSAPIVSAESVGKSQILTITLKNGLSLNVTPEHRFRTLSQEDNDAISWIKAKDINPNTPLIFSHRPSTFYNSDRADIPRTGHKNNNIGSDYAFNAVVYACGLILAGYDFDSRMVRFVTPMCAHDIKKIIRIFKIIFAQADYWEDGINRDIEKLLLGKKLTKESLLEDIDPMINFRCLIAPYNGYNAVTGIDVDFSRLILPAPTNDKNSTRTIAILSLIKAFLVRPTDYTYDFFKAALRHLTREETESFMAGVGDAIGALEQNISNHFVEGEDKKEKAPTYKFLFYTNEKNKVVLSETLQAIGLSISLGYPPNSMTTERLNCELIRLTRPLNFRLRRLPFMHASFRIEALKFGLENNIDKGLYDIGAFSTELGFDIAAEIKVRGYARIIEQPKMTLNNKMLKRYGLELQNALYIAICKEEDHSIKRSPLYRATVFDETNILEENEPSVEDIFEMSCEAKERISITDYLNEQGEFTQKSLDKLFKDSDAQTEEMFENLRLEILSYAAHLSTPSVSFGKILGFLGVQLNNYSSFFVDNECVIEHVKSITMSKQTVDCADITVYGTPTYIENGFISHNCGKSCLNENTRIQTSIGILKIKDLYERFQAGERFSVMSEDGVRKCIDVYDNGVDDTYILETNAGDIIEGTSRHKFRVLEEGKIKWKQFKDIRHGDMLIKTEERNAQMFGKHHLPADVALLLGQACSSDKFKTDDTIQAINSDKTARTDDLSSEVCRYILKDSDSFAPNTKNIINIPSILFECDEITIRHFIKGICQSGNISTKFLEKAKSIRELMSSIGIETILSKNDNFFIIKIIYSRDGFIKDNILIQNLSLDDIEDPSWVHQTLHLSKEKAEDHHLNSKEYFLEKKCFTRTIKKTSQGRVHTYDLTIDGSHTYQVNGFISHNTVGMYILIRKLYEISCYHNIPALFGLMTTANIVFMYFSLTKQQAEITGYSQFRTTVDSIPYFQEEFCRDMHFNSMLKFPENVIFRHGASCTDQIGSNLIATIMDEANFFNNSGAATDDASAISAIQTLHTSVLNRGASRFMNNGVNASISVLISSPTYSSSYTQKRIEASVGNPHAKVYRCRLWDCKPEKYSKERFYVFLGNDKIDPFIINDVEDLNTALEGEMCEAYLGKDLQMGIDSMPPRMRGKIDAIPLDFRDKFENNLIQSIMDIAGFSVAPTGRLFSSRKIWNSCINHELPEMFWKNEFTIQTEDDSDTNQIQYYLKDKFTEPKRKRYIHVDQSLVSDCTGFAVSHRGDPVLRNNSMMPTVIVDFALRITPPAAPRKISIPRVRSFIFYMMKTMKISLGKVTYDSFNSAESIETLKENGVNADHLSVDRTDDAYLGFIDMLYDNRISFTQQAADLMATEIFELVHYREKHKVDHQPNGCFVAGTHVIVRKKDSGKQFHSVPIETLIEYLPFTLETLSVNSKGDLVVAEVRTAWKVKDEDVLSHIYINDFKTPITCTADHRFMLSSGEYKQAKQLQHGDELKSYDNSLRLVVRSQLTYTELHKVPVYDMCVPEFNNYALGDGCIVHNSKDVMDAVVGSVWNALKDDNAMDMTIEDLHVGIRANYDTPDGEEMFSEEELIGDSYDYSYDAEAIKTREL